MQESTVEGEPAVVRAVKKVLTTKSPGLGHKVKVWANQTHVFLEYKGFLGSYTIKQRLVHPAMLEARAHNFDINDDGMRV